MLARARRRRAIPAAVEPVEDLQHPERPLRRPERDHQHRVRYVADTDRDLTRAAWVVAAIGDASARPEAATCAAMPSPGASRTPTISSAPAPHADSYTSSSPSTNAIDVAAAPNTAAAARTAVSSTAGGTEGRATLSASDEPRSASPSPSACANASAVGSRSCGSGSSPACRAASTVGPAAGSRKRLPKVGGMPSIRPTEWPPGRTRRCATWPPCRRAPRARHIAGCRSRASRRVVSARGRSRSRRARCRRPRGSGWPA